ncbi:MAG: hypothetical protein JO094_00560, partial [Hyphomicrobiales bacterium]|nr:hypothetical protein [Hyphomicrobiales bacterium]
EAASSASQTLNVTDPPAASSSALASAGTGAPISQLAALLDQFIAAGFHSQQPGVAQIASLSLAQGEPDLAFLTHPHH